MQTKQVKSFSCLERNKVLRVPIGMERKIGVKKAIQNNPYFFAVDKINVFLKVFFLSYLGL